MSFKLCVQQEKEKLNCKFLNETFKTFVSFKYKILPQLLTKSNHEEKNSPTYRARREYLYTRIKSQWKTPLTPTQFPESHQAQTFPTGSLKVQFSHRTICQYWRNMIWCSVDTHLHSHHRSPKQVTSQSVIGVLANIPSRIMSFSGEKQKAKNPNLYQSFWSDWHNGTLDTKFVSVFAMRSQCLRLWVSVWNSGSVCMIVGQCLHWLVVFVMVGQCLQWCVNVCDGESVCYGRSMSATSAAHHH